MVASPPPIPGRPFAALFATMTAIAPASCAFFTLTVKVHDPRFDERDLAGHLRRRS